MKQTHLTILASLLVATFQTTLLAEVKLPSIISDNMCLQADKPVPIWGIASSGENISVSFAGQTQTAVADANGRWKVTLNALPANPNAANLIVAGTNTLTISNVVVGSVWLCSGQSNMVFNLKFAHNADTEIPKSNYPNIRLFSVPNVTSIEPLSDVAGKWVECSPETAKSFSAVGYFFGREIHTATGQPMGLINSSWNGTPAQSWTSLEGLRKDEVLKHHVEVIESLKRGFPAAQEKYQKDKVAFPEFRKQWEEEVNKPFQNALRQWELEAKRSGADQQDSKLLTPPSTGREISALYNNKALPFSEAMKQWTEDTKKATASGQKAPARPQPSKPEPKLSDPSMVSSNVPSGIYNAMIAPLIPYAIQGVIWYQGEGNRNAPVEYRTLFPRLITDWREHWGVGDFPFLYVQLANFLERKDVPADDNWAWLREAQTMTLKLPNTGMATIIDIGDAKDIHPKDKMDVGHRLALIALKKVFGKDLVCSGPMFKSMSVEGSKVRLHFTEVGGGLKIGQPPADVSYIVRPSTTELKGFAIAGDDQQFVWAKATIEGQTVLVESPQITKPVAVRYGWASNPECNLYNQMNLPASPFRTDDWPMNEIKK